jgi:hypothetical protein
LTFPHSFDRDCPSPLMFMFSSNYILPPFMPRNDLPLRAPQGPPMTLANMRQNGVRMIWAKCEACGHQADVNVDTLAETLVVPKVGQRLRCSCCGGKQINTRPAWHTGRAGGRG